MLGSKRPAGPAGKPGVCIGNAGKAAASLLLLCPCNVAGAVSLNDRAALSLRPGCCGLGGIIHHGACMDAIQDDAPYVVDTRRAQECLCGHVHITPDDVPLVVNAECRPADLDLSRVELRQATILACMGQT